MGAAKKQEVNGDKMKCRHRCHRFLGAFVDTLPPPWLSPIPSMCHIFLVPL